MRRLLFIILLTILMNVPFSPAAADEDESSALFPFLHKGKYGFINRQGEIIVQPRFLQEYHPSLYDFYNGRAAVNIEGKWGYIDNRGEVVIQPEYQYGFAFVDGVALVIHPDSSESYIDTDGNPAFDFEFACGLPYQDGIAVVFTECESESPSLFYGSSGELVGRTDRHVVHPFSDGLAAFHENYKYGYLDTDGHVVIEAKFDGVDYFEGGMARVFTREGETQRPRLIDRRGETVIYTGEFIGRRFSDGRLLALSGRKFGYLNREGEWIIEPVYDDASEFSEGLALVRSGEDLLIIDPDGKEQARVDSMRCHGQHRLEPIRNGLFRVYLPPIAAIIDSGGNLISRYADDYTGWEFSEGLSYHPGTDEVVDLQGNVVFSVDAVGLSEFSEGLAGSFTSDATESMRHGFVDATGSQVIENRFDSAFSFSQGLAAVERNGAWGFINKDGETVIPFAYDYVGTFSDNRASFWRNGKSGYLNLKGEEVIGPRYGGASEFSQGLACVELDGKWGFISPKGIMVIEAKYEDARSFSEGLAAVKSGGRWGFINRLGRMVIEPKYAFADSFSEGLAVVSEIGFDDEWAEVAWTQLVLDSNDIMFWQGEESGLKFIDRTGATVIEDKRYIIQGGFSEGRARVYRNDDGTIDFIDKIGAFITDFHLTKAGDYSQGRAWIVLPETVVYISRDGTIVWPPTY